MSFPEPLPRPDQIAELTRGLDLPLAAIDDIYLHIIADGVAQAFEDIRATSPTIVATGGEAEVTALLEARLNRMIEEDQVWRQLVAAVVRGKESLSFNGVHLEKRPDLSILLSARALRFPLIAEAKIIDATKGENLYCSQGLRRFLDGEYGWGGREAFMIAYVRDGTTIASRLEPYLAQTAQATNYAVQDAPIVLSTGGCDAARSRHGRSFLYTHMAPPANDPGSIALWHLWVDASAPTA
ncbi:hypothetical protein [Mesorhizobium sp. L48C026A00]|uniref:hypothetical protein n=1 Tax=Mesorhizobium sp. L48C026A00 TaxID=1287182 RepID=UPI0003CFCB79|nr:hypothetical protein [Mesorhizobium sp. L48C026A00]ESZ15220.1 hypothetical protein X737_22070 [Mesorhizobium sp. L48C026A00]